ncbi:hypothetical protein IMZ48_09065, partial [Candidatus Bathyarchaeota archaeon]|nr:hypothetical protein [Candidatus Bathyarchaeota archaeon]
MSQQLPPTLGRGEGPKKPRNTRLRNLRHRIRAVQKSGQQHRSSTPNAHNRHHWFLRDEQALHSHASDKARSAHRGGKDDDVVLNFQNMDQDFALRPVTSNSVNTYRSPDTSNNVQPPSSRATQNRPRTPAVVTAGHTRLTTDERGQLRYFGYSSLMRVVSILPPSSPSNSTTSAEPETLNETREDMATLADSAETHHHLLDLFFRYQHAALPVIDQTAFRKAHARGKRTEYY